MKESLNIKPTVATLFIIATLCVCLPAGIAQAAKLYKWVDADGNISYQDQPPPSGSAVKQEVLRNNTTAEPSTASATQSIQDQTSSVLVYTIDNCDTCEMLLLRLRQLGVPNQELSLLDRDVQARVLSLSESLSAPTLFIGNKLISDISLDNLIVELKSAGHEIPARFLDDPDDTQETDSDNSPVDP